ncbi:hypothetical protein VTN77DRAFT_3656 [Rasamsonia byssochlamydoides]|uniref:uncharacterized protein n=1 Tax=Rasamsonia byssochlamydoides TaxID=89139 RepID=UPI00374245E0
MSHNNAGLSKKRRREPYNVDVKLVEIYEDLANEKDEIRLKAAQELVSRFTPESNPTVEQVQKALQRLFRGLCSGRKAARVGFSIALTEVLAQVFAPGRKWDSAELNISKVLEIWETVSDVAGSESGQEQRDHYFGRLFGAEAIIKSSILFQPDVPFEKWTKLLTLVVDLAKKKPWIREECGWVIYRGIYDLAAQKADAKFVEAAVDQLCSNDLARTPEAVSVWLAAKDLFPNANLPKNVWKYDDPLDAREKSVLSRVMKESSAGEDESNKEGGSAKNTTGVWTSKLHFAWDAVLTRIYDVKPAQGKSKDKDKLSKSSRISFVDFWIEVVDNGLFAAASSEERKYWGFLLFIKALNEAPLHLASLVFTKNLVRCLMNQLAVEDRYLHRMAQKAAKSIHARVSKEPEFAAAAVNGLLGPSGSVNFDQITKTKTVDKIVVEASPDALKQIVSLLERLIAVPGTDGQAAASSRQSLAGLLVSIVRSRSSAGEEYQPIMEDVLSVFVRFAYFVAQGDNAPQPSLSQTTQELFRTRINSCLNSLISNSKDPAGLSYSVVRKIRDSAKSAESGKFIIEMDDKIRESVEGAFKSLKKLSSKAKHSDKDQNISGIQAFRLLYSMTILQVFNGDADAVSMLDELGFCYSKFWGKKSDKEEDTSDASNALVEILLSFASKPSQLFRRMSEQVFGVFADQVTADGLESLISVLEAKENLAGQQEMFEQQGDDEDEEMVDVDDEDDDVEVVDADHDHSEESTEESSDESSSDDEDDEDEDEDEEELAAFDAKLAEALGTHRTDQDLNEDSSGSDADMNDDEMEALDDQLAKVFKARSQALSKKKDKKDAKETMVNFKNRVLDLLEIYVKKCHSSILALDLILPLLRLTRKSSVKQISQKANAVLREYTKLCKGSALPSLKKTEDEDEEEEPEKPVWELLRAVHKEATLSGPPAHSSSCSQASLLLVKVLVAHNKDNISAIVDLYAETRKQQLLSKKCHVQPSFFTDWNNWCVSAGKQLKNQ